MTNRVFSFDLGRIMDEAFKFAESFGGTFDHDVIAEKMRHAAEQLGRGPFGNPDYYPAYMYPPATICLTREKKLVLELALAGFEEKDITVQFRGDHLLFVRNGRAGDNDNIGLQRHCLAPVGEGTGDVEGCGEGSRGRLVRAAQRHDLHLRMAGQSRQMARLRPGARAQHHSFDGHFPIPAVSAPTT